MNRGNTELKMLIAFVLMFAIAMGVALAAAEIHNNSGSSQMSK